MYDVKGCRIACTRGTGIRHARALVAICIAPPHGAPLIHPYCCNPIVQSTSAVRRREFRGAHVGAGRWGHAPASGRKRRAMHAQSTRRR
eukprot:5810064-Prymnesium_polylepis.1